jgi:hypothetical protein
VSTQMILYEVNGQWEDLTEQWVAASWV